ncbi:HET-domain-containing protein, partial [Cryphonectria parasitica EP155]
MPCDSWYAPSTKPDHDPFLLFPQYQYRPLPDGDYIRVLILEPGCGNEPLVCSLKATDLSDTETRIEYEAVSYAWGSGTKDQALLVNNSLCIITRNLRRALEQTRYTDKQRRLWADSICINQHDLAEKGHQVGLMARIYSESSCALICMGSAVAHRAAAIELSGLVSDVNHMIWKSVGRLLSLPWFRRGWVVQEAA